MQNARKEHATLQNSNYRKDIRYVLRLNILLLSFIGIYPFAIRGLGRYASNIVIIICNCLLSFAVIPCVLHIMYDQKDIIVRLKLGGLLNFCFIAITKYCILAIRRPKILHCIEHVKNDWWQVKSRSDREHMIRYATIGRNITIFCAASMYIGNQFYYLILPWFYNGVTKVENRTIRKFGIPVYSGFRQLHTSPMYEIAYFAQYICGYVMLSITSITCGLTSMFVTHACGQIQIIMTRVEDLLDSKSFEKMANVHQQLNAIVKKHVQVIKFASAIDELLQEVCLVEFTGSILTICLAEYICIVDWQAGNNVSLMTYFVYSVTFSFNIYILCYIGELLMEKSTQIGMKCYMINWYELSSRRAHDLVMIINMSNCPIKISAGRMVDLSITTFGNIMKTTLAYLSFLRTLLV